MYELGFILLGMLIMCVIGVVLCKPARFHDLTYRGKLNKHMSNGAE